MQGKTTATIHKANYGRCQLPFIYSYLKRKAQEQDTWKTACCKPISGLKTEEEKEEVDYGYIFSIMN